MTINSGFCCWRCFLCNRDPWVT